MSEHCYYIQQLMPARQLLSLACTSDLLESHLQLLLVQCTCVQTETPSKVSIAVKAD